MTFSEILTDVGAGIAAVGAIATILAHVPFFPPKYAEFFARISLYAANWKFSVNQRDTMPKDPKAPGFGSFGGMGPMGGMLVLCLCFSLFACSVFGAHGSFWPAIEHCAPSPASLVSQVEDILLAGGDYETALKTKALQDGAGIVECAVAAAVDLLTAKAGKVGASPETAPAAVRGKMFLAKVSAQ